MRIRTVLHECCPIVQVAGSATTVVFFRGCERHPQGGVIGWHVEVRLAGCLCFEIDRQVAVYQRGMASDVVNALASDGVNGIDAIFWSCNS